MKIRRFSELSKLSSFEERYKYLRLGGVVGAETFGFDRYLNQGFYKLSRWRSTRNKVIIRDNGCDLGIDGHEIHDKILVHHMNPISVELLEAERDELFDPEFLICTSFNTHQAIHYGDASLLPEPLIVRTPNDTSPWRQIKK